MRVQQNMDVQKYLSDYHSGAISAQKSNKNENKIGSTSMRKFESEERTVQKQTKSVVDQSLSYADQLKASRAKQKDTSLQKKKLQYSYKKISSQIVRSKNSISARKAVQAARSEVNRLKRMKGSGEYDEDEIQLAIDHAKSMEKVAKKKVVHLEQEEMVERNKNGAFAKLKEFEEEQEKTSDGSGAVPEEEEALGPEAEQTAAMNAQPYNMAQGLSDYTDLEADIAQELSAEKKAKMYESVSVEELSQMYESMSGEYSQPVSDFGDSMEELMSAFSEEMAEMMEDMDLTELSESMFAPSPNMSEDDLKILKIKHREKEMTDIAKADKDYLKGMIEHEKNKGISLPGFSGSSMPGISSNPSPMPTVSMPGGGGAAPVMSGGFNVFV